MRQSPQDVLPGLTLGDVALIGRRPADGDQVDVAQRLVDAAQAVIVAHVDDIAGRFVKMLSISEASVDDRRIR